MRESALRAARAGLLGWAAVACLLLTGAAPAAADTTGWTATGSAEQVYVVGLSPSERMSLVSPAGRVVKTQAADSLGGLLFRNVAPGTGYTVRPAAGGAASPPLTVHSDANAPWDPNIYNQAIPDDGYTYLTTRDGTKLAIDVHPPLSPAGEPGLPASAEGLLPLLPAGAGTPPWPTLIEYSGYGYADPSGPVNGIAILANLMGFAVVDVSMRGTGCSGGAYDFFEPLQNLDGYDAIETIAHQPWVLNHKVGMFGISYGGISQLFTAQTDPPDLAAIVPLSVIDQTITTLYPGGILNTGFAVAWAEERQAEAQPAGQGLKGTQPYAESQIASGDQTCKDNQVLHGEANDLLAKIRANDHYVPKVADPLDPTTFVNKIHVPVFMACQLEDEQVGAHCPDLVPRFTGTTQKWFTFTNGTHVDSLDPSTLNHIYDFLSLFVAGRSPLQQGYSGVLQAAAPVVYQSATGTNDDTLPVDPIQSQPTFDSAMAAFKAIPEVTVNFDNGAGSDPENTQAPGDPYSTFSAGFPSFPVPGTVAKTWYLGSGGALTGAPPRHRETDMFTWDPKAMPAVDWTSSNTSGGGLWGDVADWGPFHWQQNPAGTALSYITAPLTQDTTVFGGGAVHLWVRAAARNVDFSVTVSEVRPDGQEEFVQNGWLRARDRALDRSQSTLLTPVLSLRAKDMRPLPRGRFVELVIPLYYEGHVYRAGSRIRLTIAEPNGTQPIWSFAQEQPRKRTRVWVQLSRRMPSSLILPVVPGVNVTAGLPPCPSLRNEPCRTYVPFRNEVSR